MGDNFLQSFLKTGLFDIGDSDERLTWLQQSIEELQKVFEDDHSLLPVYSLVAIDPKVSDKEPILGQVESIVTKYWKALRIKHPEMPINILRGVILNALNNIGNSDPIAARIIYLTMSNFYPYAKLNAESVLVESMLNELGELAEKNAIEEWSFIEDEPSLKLGSLKLSKLQFGEITMNAKQLQPKLKIAIENEPTGHGSNNGGASVWGEHFANKASEGIASSFNEAIKEIGDVLSPQSIEIPINKFFTTFKKSLDSNLKASFSSLTAVERRSKLLWWKETLYSQSLKLSYRDLDNHLLPIIMSIDLNNQIPEITPISVDFLLRDTLYLLNDKKNITIKFKDFLSKISDDSLKSTLKPYFTVLKEDDESRISISDFIALLVNDRLTTKDFERKTGVRDKEEITLGELSVFILHDLLTQRLIEA